MHFRHSKTMQRLSSRIRFGIILEKTNEISKFQNSWFFKNSNFFHVGIRSNATPASTCPVVSQQNGRYNQILQQICRFVPSPFSSDMWFPFENLPNVPLRPKICFGSLGLRKRLDNGECAAPCRKAISICWLTTGHVEAGVAWDRFPV